MNASPILNDVRRDGDAIVFEWSGDQTTRWTAGKLRRECPCATCREKRRGESESVAAKPAGLPVLSAAEAKPLTVQTLRPVGNYAYNVVFSDGHHSGLFTLEMLRDNPSLSK